MTGPALPIEGEMALRDLFGPIDLAPFANEAGGGGRYAILDADMKYFVAEYHSQGPVLAALRLRHDLDIRDPDIGAVAAIMIDTYAFAHREIGSGAIYRSANS
jgi:2-methylcitrate dehydratase PrpD